jgi:hypothetical protein
MYFKIIIFSIFIYFSTDFRDCQEICKNITKKVVNFFKTTQKMVRPTNKKTKNAFTKPKLCGTIEKKYFLRG